MLSPLFSSASAYNSLNAGTANLAEKEGRVNNSKIQGKEKRREIRIIFGGGFRVVKLESQVKSVISYKL